MPEVCDYYIVQLKKITQTLLPTVSGPDPKFDPEVVGNLIKTAHFLVVNLH